MLRMYVKITFDHFYHLDHISFYMDKLSIGSLEYVSYDYITTSNSIIIV